MDTDTETDFNIEDYIEKYDVEESAAYKKIEAELEALIEERLKGFPRGLGFCHIYWSVKKEILKEKYNIDWKSPAERYPHVMFD